MKSIDFLKESTGFLTKTIDCLKKSIDFHKTIRDVI